MSSFQNGRHSHLRLVDTSTSKASTSTHKQASNKAQRQWDFFKGMYPILRKEGMTSRDVAILAGLIDDSEENTITAPLD